MTPLVSVVVVSYQTRDLTVACLRALIGATVAATPYELIVVDNASTDGSSEAVRAAVPEARLVQLAHNVGFGRAVNVGAQVARGRWLLLLNPDTLPDGDVIGGFAAAAAATPGTGIWTGRTLRLDGADDERSCLGLPSLWSLFCFAVGLSTLFRRSGWFNPEGLPRLDRSRPARVPAASGCLLLVDLALFRRLGGFAPDYFMYSEDLDLCVRAVAAGAAVRLEPTVRVRHLGGAASDPVRKRVMVLQGKSTFLLARWSRPRAWLGLRLLTAGIGLRAWGSLASGRARYWREVWRRRAVWSAGWPPVAQMPPVEVIGAGRLPVVPDLGVSGEPGVPGEPRPCG